MKNVATFVLLVLMTGIANAQSASSSRSSLGALSRAQGALNVNANNRPTVSPYLKLLNNYGNTSTGFGNVQPVYQTQVRPALQQRQQQAQQAQQIQRIQRDLNQVRNQYTQPNSGYMTTGHPTRYMTYSHYYPSLGY